MLTLAFVKRQFVALPCRIETVPSHQLELEAWPSQSAVGTNPAIEGGWTGESKGRVEMGKNRLDIKFTRVFLAIVFAWTNVAMAEGEVAPTVIISAEPVSSAQGESGLGIKMEVYEGDNAERAVQEALAKNPEGTVTVFTSERELSKLGSSSANLQVIKVEPAALREEAEQLKIHDPALKKLIDQQKKVPGRAIKLAKDTLVTIAGAGGFATCYYLLRGNLDIATKMFLVGLIVNGFQVFASSKWRSYLHAGGDLAKRATNAFSSWLGFAASSGNIAKDAGQVAAALLFNLGVTLSVLQLQGVRQNALWVLAIAAAGCWDAIWDLVIDRHIREGNLNEEHFSKFVKFRVIFGPWVEMAAYSGATIGALATALMALVGGSGIISYMTATHIASYLKKTKGASKAKAWWKFRDPAQIQEPYERVECGTILESKSKTEAKPFDEAS